MLIERALSQLYGEHVPNTPDLLHEDVTLRVWRWDGLITTRGRDRVAGWFRDEWAGWTDATLEVFAPLAESDRAAVEFRIQATEGRRYIEHNRTLWVRFIDGQAYVMDLYCGEPVVSARRADYIAPATLTESEVAAFLEASTGVFDPRAYVSPNWQHHRSLRQSIGGSGDPHPGSNSVFQVRWSADEADRRIEEVIAHHRDRNVGFQWFVGPFDTPPDLAERLVRHGLMFAGAEERMARVGLDALDVIPENPRVTVELVDGSDSAALSAIVGIVGTCFRLTPEQVHDLRVDWAERLKNPDLRKTEFRYLARLAGEPVAMGTLLLRNGRVYLGGAATLPAYRGQHLYSTLLKQRLRAARALGYHIATIDAGPMSRPIVARYGFKSYGTMRVFGWMPVMDPEVIRSLVTEE
jgi:hypothetical protein